MLDPENPLSAHGPEDDPVGCELYREDLNAPTPIEEADNCVVVSPIHVLGVNLEQLTSHLCDIECSKAVFLRSARSRICRQARRQKRLLVLCIAEALYVYYG